MYMYICTTPKPLPLQYMTYLPVPAKEPLHALGVVEQAVQGPQGQQSQSRGHAVSHQHLTQFLHHTMLDEGVGTLAAEAGHAGHETHPRLQAADAEL